jgi:hypothetical protein
MKKMKWVFWSLAILVASLSAPCLVRADCYEQCNSDYNNCIQSGSDPDTCLYSFNQCHSWCDMCQPWGC